MTRSKLTPTERNTIRRMRDLLDSYEQREGNVTIARLLEESATRLHELAPDAIAKRAQRVSENASAELERALSNDAIIASLAPDELDDVELDR